MKKILVSVFLLVFGLCLVGCEQLHTGPKEDIIIDGEYYAKVIYNSPFLSSSAYSRKIIIDNNKLDDLEFIDYELQGDFFTSIPNTDKDVFLSIMNIEKIWFAEVLQPEDIEGEFGYYLTLVNSNYYLYYGRYTEDSGYSINHAFKLIRLDTEKEILCDFLTLLNPLSVTLINGNDNSMIDKSYYDFESQLFFEEFMQIEVSKLDNFEKYDMPDVDYYISFSTFTEDFVSLQFYSVKNSNYEQYYGRIDGNLLDGIYQFSINKDLFNKVFDYFTNNTKFEESLYKLTIQNDSSNELIGIKNEYKAGEEVEVKMEYDMAVEAYVFLNGELLGTLNGSNSLKFNMPEKDSTLVVTYTNGEIYKLNVIDNFDLIEEELNEYYASEEIIIFHISHELYDNITVTINGKVEEGIPPLIETHNFKIYSFRMPEEQCEIKVTVNGLSDYSCNDNLHHYEEEIKKVDNSYIKESTCKLCGEIIQEEITKIKLDTTILYFGSYSDDDSFELFVKEYNLSNRKYLIIDNVEAYYEIYPNIPRMNKELLSEEEADEFFKNNIIVLHIRYISGTLDFVPVNYYYNTVLNNIIMEYINDVSGAYITQFLGNTLDIITIPKEYYNKIVE